MIVNKNCKNGQNIIGIIHARGGSKRIPLKNIKPLRGRPLITYMIRAALESRYLRRVIVSTDHPEIKRISLECGAEVPFTRPKDLAEDCPSEWVTQHAVKFVEEQEGGQIDVAVTMQPTTPFCLGSDIDACVEMLLASEGFGSVFSAGMIVERPEWMYTLGGEGNAVELFIKGEIKGERGISQSLPPMVMPNGAVYATRRETLFNEGVIISGRSAVHIMPPERSVDIDEPLDFIFAEFVAERIKA
jgi:CMP-N-acetylneuraminic acid synthetase